MTASTVTQVKSYFDGTTSASAAKGNATDEFAKVFEKNSSANIAPEKEQNTPVKETPKSAEKASDTAAKSQEKESVQKVTDDKTTVKTELATEETDVDTEELEEKGSILMTQLSAAMQKIQEMLDKAAQVLEVSGEDVLSAMQELGMEAGDILNADNIPKLAIALTEGADEFLAMTDENLFADIKELMGTAKELLSQLSEELGQGVADTQAMLEEMTDVIPEVVVETDVSEEPLMNSRFEETTTSEVVEEVPQEMVKEVPKHENTSKESGQGNAQEFSFSQNVMEQLKNAVGKAQDVQNTTYTAATTESIMNQITEAVKMTMKEDMTQMELQLHPASLGNVRVQVAAKDGVITASFTTQNEQVKAALESQIVVLKENFEQQGIKVEAVEVTVASHAFERNLDSNENSSKDQMTEKKKAVRRINLSNVTDDFEEEGLLEEEKIVADMMRQNGNTVDYTA